TQVDALPGAQCQSAVGHRDGQGAADQHALDVGRHVVRALGEVFVVGGVLRHHYVEVAFQVAPHVGVGVLVDGQGGGGVLDKQVEQAHLAIGQGGPLRQNVLGDEVEPARLCRQ